MTIVIRKSLLQVNMMFGLFATLLMLGGCMCVDRHHPSSENRSSPYVQSWVDFFEARLLLQELV